ncbi:MAG TPA: three-Cys-motif partner protein TcmP, partial [Ohtaekwangia sp.]
MNFKSSHSVQFFQPDGFTVTAAEPWFKVKVQVITNYIQSFTTHAVQKADEIIIVDLFAGSGLFSVGHQREIFPSASLMALGEDLPVSKWILCEQDAELIHAIKTRVNRYYPTRNVLTWNISPDEWVDGLRSFIPPSKSGFRTAVLCIVDPFSIDIPFRSIDKLASLGYSFLIPYTFTLNERKNVEYYL